MPSFDPLRWDYLSRTQKIRCWQHLHQDFAEQRAWVWEGFVAERRKAALQAKRDAWPVEHLSQPVFTAVQTRIFACTRLDTLNKRDRLGHGH